MAVERNTSSFGCRGAMEKKRTIIDQWLQNKCQSEKEALLSELGQQMHQSKDMPVKGIIEQLAAGLMVACADELGLSPMELTGLLRTPRKDALAGLVTVLHTDG